MAKPSKMARDGASAIANIHLIFIFLFIFIEVET